MDNVVRIIYREDLNQMRLIGKYRIGEIKSPDFDATGFLREEIAGYIEGVESLDNPGAGVVLGFCFSNMNSNHAYYSGNPKSRTLTRMVFPLHGEEVEYIIKKGNFFVNTGTDPVIIHKSSFITEASLSDSTLLFGADPFENPERYRRAFYPCFEDMMRK